MRWMTSGGRRPLTLVAPMRTDGGFVAVRAAEATVTVAEALTVPVPAP
jgi:hypothetical protein